MIREYKRSEEKSREDMNIDEKRREAKIREEKRI
jgi:hypothetical protein